MAVTNTAAFAIAHLRGAYSSALAQCAVLANRKYVTLVVDRVITLYDDDLHGNDVAKRALAVTMALDLSRFALRSLKQLGAHRALCFVAELLTKLLQSMEVMLVEVSKMREETVLVRQAM